MSNNKIYLGKAGDECIYLSKHSWDCNWYWDFGYIGNNSCHFHIESWLDHKNINIKDIFSETNISQSHWWIIRDLFIQAYALRRAADTYRYGGHQTDDAKPLRVIDPDMATRLNADLKVLLDTIWIFINEATKR